jgi:hypothetical protein
MGKQACPSFLSGMPASAPVVEMWMPVHRVHSANAIHIRSRLIILIVIPAKEAVDFLEIHGF